MKRIILIGEGPTEQSFCADVLMPYFAVGNIYLQNPVIKKTSGGIVNWYALKHQIELHLRQDPTAFVTTLIDFYGLHAHHRFPEWEQAKKLADKSTALDQIEKGMKQDIDADLQRRFIPYIQLHEFEGLLFSDIQVFDESFERAEFSDYNYLVQTIQENENPEMINDGDQTAPSKRLAKIIKGYDKTTLGVLLAASIGLDKIMNKCPRFRQWIIELETI